MVTAEALSCGTPVIVLDTSAVKELVGENTGIILNRHNTEDYLNALKRIELSNFHSKEIERYAERFSSEKMTETVLKLYEQ